MNKVIHFAKAGLWLPAETPMNIIARTKAKATNPALTLALIVRKRKKVVSESVMF